MHFKSGKRHERAVEGEWKLDRKFDGVSRTKPDGVIYLVSGGGGAKLDNPEQHSDPASLQEFTCKYVADTHSLTYASLVKDLLRIRQIAEDGKWMHLP